MPYIEAATENIPPLSLLVNSFVNGGVTPLPGAVPRFGAQDIVHPHLC